MRVGVDRIRHRIGRHSCSKLASRLLPGSRYRSSPVRLMLIPTHGVLPTVPRAGLTVGSSPSNNAAQRSAETAVSASQTSSTPDLKLRPPAANESTNRANARLQECVALPEGARCPLLAQSGHRVVHCKCPLLGVKRTCLFARPNPVPAGPTDSGTSEAISFQKALHRSCGDAVALGTEPSNHRGGNFRDIRVVVVGLALMNIGDV